MMKNQKEKRKSLYETLKRVAKREKKKKSNKQMHLKTVLCFTYNQPQIISQSIRRKIKSNKELKETVFSCISWKISCWNSIR